MGLLDGIHRRRFAEGSEALAGWNAACNVVGPLSRRREEEIPATIDGEIGNPPPDSPLAAPRTGE